MLHAPRALPDEAAFGYLGRVLRLNGAPESLPLATAFVLRDGRTACPATYSASRMLTALTQVAGQSLSEFVRAHTSIPVRGAVFQVIGGDWCDAGSESSVFRSTEMHVGENPWGLCRACADEDLDFWGFSYWRRSHQVNGIVLCSKHGMPLCHLRGANVWRSLPHEVASASRPVPDDVVRDAAQNPVIQRMADVFAELWQRQRPLPRLHVACALQRRVRRLLRVSRGTLRDSNIFDWAQAQLAGPWQQTYLTGVVGNRLDSIQDAVFRLRGTPGALSYALAFALLFDSVDEAMTELQRPLQTGIDPGAAGPAHEFMKRVDVPDVSLLPAMRSVLAGCAIHDAAAAARVASPALERALLRWVVAPHEDAETIASPTFELL